MSEPSPVLLREHRVDGVAMAYREVGEGDPVLLLHGNPTSSDLWRDVLPRLTGVRVLAPDLVGMGRSGKLPGSGDERYRYLEHRRYLDGLLDALDLGDRVVLVGHDWGGVLSVDWARRHPDRVRGIGYLETLAVPVDSDSPNAPDPGFFGPLRSPAGERLVLEQNLVVEQVLPAGTLRTLTEAERHAYREPFLRPGEGRRPTLTWTREIPIDGEPADVHDVVAANAAFMAASDLPKLLINGDPGALLTGPMLDRCRTWPAQREVTVPGAHFLPEDSPGPIADALNDWLAGLD